jgi:hydroxyethylthiazole kinase-like uncharacterized protein yjeF
LDLPPADPAGWLNTQEHFATVAAPRRRDTHKGSFGDVAVVGGGVGMVGAPLLAARAALRLGAGRVYVDSIGAPQLRLDPAQPELMFRPLASLHSADAWVVGCGLGTDQPARNALANFLDRDGAVVFDADALHLMSADSDLRARCVAAGATRVLTPHPLEAARLLGTDAPAVQADRIAAVRQLAQRFAALVVLKGAGSVIADVLAGMIGALLAQHYDPLQAVLAAVWLHGAAADRFGADVGLVAGDLPALAATVLAEERGATQG